MTKNEIEKCPSLRVKSDIALSFRYDESVLLSKRDICQAYINIFQEYPNLQQGVRSWLSMSPAYDGETYTISRLKFWDEYCQTYYLFNIPENVSINENELKQLELYWSVFLSVDAVSRRLINLEEEMRKLIRKIKFQRNQIGMSEVDVRDLSISKYWIVILRQHGIHTLEELYKSIGLTFLEVYDESTRKKGVYTIRSVFQVSQLAAHSLLRVLDTFHEPYAY